MYRYFLVLHSVHICSAFIGYRNIKNTFKGGRSRSRINNRKKTKLFFQVEMNTFSNELELLLKMQKSNITATICCRLILFLVQNSVMNDRWWLRWKQHGNDNDDPNNFSIGHSKMRYSSWCNIKLTSSMLLNCYVVIGGSIFTYSQENNLLNPFHSKLSKTEKKYKYVRSGANLASLLLVFTSALKRPNQALQYLGYGQIRYNTIYVEAYDWGLRQTINCYLIISY